MSYPAPSDFAKIAELERQQNEIRDIVFFNSVHAISQSSPFGQGRKNTALGSKLGSESWFPLESAITDINELLVSTGVFDKLDVQSIANVIVGPVGTLILKTIKNISDGKIFSVTPGTGRTLEITPGGGGGDDGKGIDVPSTLTLTDKDMVFMQYFKDTDKVKILTGGGGGSSTLPAGSTENEHLEWDDTTKTWNAVQSMTHGATGPFAATGFHRFANDQIMLSSRLFGDGGDYQIKLNASDILDFTRDDNGITSIQLRSQHAVDPDQVFTISQQSGTGGGVIFTDPGFYQFEVGATTLLVFDSPAANQGRIKFAGTPAFDNFQIAFETDTYFTGSGTPGRLNVVSSGTNVFTFQTTGASFLGTANLFFNGGFIQFSGTAPTSGQVRFANDTIGLTWRGITAFNVEMKVDTTGAFDFTRDDNGITTLKIRSQDAIVADNILTISQQGGTGGGALFGDPNFYQFDVGATTLFTFDEPAAGQGRIIGGGTPAFNRFQIAFETNTYFTGSGTAGRLNVVTGGVNRYWFTNSEFVIGNTENLLLTGSVNGGFIQAREVAADPGGVLDNARLYAKEDVGVTKFFIQESDGTVVGPLGAGGGGLPHLDGNGATTIIENTTDTTKDWRMNLSPVVTGGVKTFTWVGGGTQTHTFQSTGGLIAQLDAPNPQVFSANVEFNGNIKLGDSTIDNITGSAKYNMNIIANQASGGNIGSTVAGEEFFNVYSRRFVMPQFGTVDTARPSMAWQDLTIDIWRFNVPTGDEFHWYVGITPELELSNVALRLEGVDLDMDSHDISDLDNIFFNVAGQVIRPGTTNFQIETTSHPIALRINGLDVLKVTSTKIEFSEDLVFTGDQIIEMQRKLVNPPTAPTNFIKIFVKKSPTMKIFYIDDVGTVREVATV